MNNALLELGIAILPDEVITQEAERLGNLAIMAINRTHLKVNKTINTPHISLYHLAANDSNLETIKKALYNISARFQSFPVEMDNHLAGHLHYIFWNASPAKNCPQMNALAQSVIKEISPLRSEKLLAPVADFYAYFPSEHKQLIAEFGVPFGLPGINFNPHITVVYNININPIQTPTKDIETITEAIKDIVPAQSFQFSANKIALVELGYSGNVIKVVDVFNLS